MASFPGLSRKYSSLLGIPFPTLDLSGRHLREAGLLSVHGYGRGGAEMTARDAAVLLVAALIDHERGGDHVKEVKGVLDLPLFGGQPITMHPDHFADGLAIKSARNAGEAIEALFYDVLRDRIRRPMEDMNRDMTLTLAIDPTGSVVSPMIQGPSFPQHLGVALFVYRRGPEPKKRNVERNTIVHGRVLLEIARLLELEVPEPA